MSSIITDIKKRQMFKALANKSQYQVGVDFGLSDRFNNNVKIVNFVNSVYKEVLKDPQKFSINQEVVELVEKGMEARRGMGVSQRRDIELTKEIQEGDLVLQAKNKGWVLLNRKLDYLLRNPRAFRNESVISIAKVAGIVFDKSQIIKGQATEHIAIRAKVADNITLEEATQQLLRFRETQTKEE